MPPNAVGWPGLCVPTARHHFPPFRDLPAMTQDSTAALSALTGHTADPAALAAQRKAAAEAARAATIAEIKEKGFSAYVEDLEKEKIEKLREELLRTLGLTEEDLAEMEPAARNAIEERISQEIQKRLAAASLVNAEGKDDPAAQQTVRTALQIIQGGGMLGSALGEGGGPLDPAAVLALQEVGQDSDQETRTGVTADITNSRERGRGLPG